MIAESKSVALPKILLRHRDFLIVHKPPHLLVHPTKPTGEATLLSWLQEQEAHLFLSLVNRLDRETSGIVIAARSAEAASRFGKMLMQRSIQKEYRAIVFGKVLQGHGKIETPLGRLGISEKNPIYLKQGIIPEGAPSLTEYWIEARNENFSLLKVQLHTGRLHQIRVHLASIGHPVVGDKIYGRYPEFYLQFIEQGWTAEMERELLFSRHALHASSIQFLWENESFEINDPLPEDLQNFVAIQFQELQKL